MLPHTTVALRRRAPEALAALDAAAGRRDGGAGAAAGQPRGRPAAARPRGHRGGAGDVRRRSHEARQGPRRHPARRRASRRSELSTRQPSDARAAHRSDGRRRRALRLRRGAPRRRPRRGDRRPQRRASTRSTARRSEGIGVRVRVGGGWGFAATRDVTRAGRAGGAGPRARASPRRSPRRRPRRSRRSTAGARALGLALRARPVRRRAGGQARAALRRRGGAAHRRRAPRAHASPPAARWRERKAFASTEGAACTQETVACGAGIAAYATDGSDLQVRSYPTAHGGGLSAAAGWEHVLRPRPRRATRRAWPRRRSRC